MNEREKPLRGGTPAGGAPPGKTYHELAENFVRQLTKLLSEITPDGFCFRVDHDLRPEGSKGPLTNSFDAAIRYYEQWGRDWERMAWVRGFPVAGDIALGERFLKELTPFVWRKHIRLVDLKNLKKLKEELEKSHKAENIKTGAGGIREIEFIVHSLQLLYGGKQKSLRTHNTMNAIHALKKHLPQATLHLLDENYRLWRELENSLQMAQDRQTHDLPTDEMGWVRLATLLGHNPKALPKEIEERRAEIHHLFRNFFETDYEKVTLREALRTNTTTAANEEEIWEGLAWFKQQESKRILSFFDRGQWPLPEILKNLTFVAEAILEEACTLLQKKLHQKDLVVLGLGSLGAREMDFYSDLDLIFLGEDPKLPKLVQRLITRFAIPSRYGRIYPIDCDLRPGGRGGVLVATPTAFLEYQRQLAWIEKFLHTKTRVIVGKLPGDWNELWVQNFDSSSAKKEIAYFREKSERELAREKPGTYHLKEGPGGIATLEAILRFLQLQYGKGRQALRQTNTFALLEALHSEQLLSDEVHASLQDALYGYRQLLLLFRWLGATSSAALSIQSPLGLRVAEKLGMAPEALEERLLKQRKKTKEIYDRIFG